MQFLNDPAPTGTRVLVLKGGPDAEREVSIRSGTMVAAALRRAGMEVTEATVDRASSEEIRALRGDVVFPKSMSPARMKENFEIFDFEITDEEIEALTALDRGAAGRQGPDPDTFDVIP